MTGMSNLDEIIRLRLYVHPCRNVDSLTIENK